MREDHGEVAAFLVNHGGLVVDPASEELVELKNTQLGR